MKILNLCNQLWVATKHSALAIAVGAAVILGAGQSAHANLTYTFTGTGADNDTPNLEGWTLVHSAGWAKYSWWGSDGNIGDNWSDAQAQLSHSPAFKLNGSGPLTFQMVGAPASPAPSPVSAAGVPTVNSAAIPSTAIVTGGFMGVALREVATDTYVLWKPHAGTDFGPIGETTPAWPDQSFSQAEHS